MDVYYTYSHHFMTYIPRVRKILWRRKWQSTPVFLLVWTEEPGRLQSMGSQRVRHEFVVSFLQAAGLHFLSLLDCSPW